MVAQGTENCLDQISMVLVMVITIMKALAIVMSVICSTVFGKHSLSKINRNKLKDWRQKERDFARKEESP